MQFPREIAPPPGSTQNLYAILPRGPMVAARRISEHEPMSLASVQRPLHRPVEASQGSEDQRSWKSRRRCCRRVLGQTVWLDTRSGTDRRGGERRAGEAAFNVDVRV